ncbi:type VI secretion system protein TssA [Halarcobacter anaerophilus]|uniref:type VI secretion system protein TssA n=1 Tax=Halarcobacter anaerophilus TaxID=877500 RepID=UPI001163D176|nr:type VI secretion system protein TssA [Halarcobacter anaerophilus]QDF28477.1 type VI secretion system, baseplate protein [Halarcobacter anaerophilus]
MSELILREFESTQKYGIDCRYEDLYLLIEQEVDKDYSVTQESSDWNYIYKNTQELLENKTKDLKLASWWLFSSWKNNLWEGLDDNLTFYISFIEKFKQELFPKSLKAKSNIFLWLETSLTNEIINNETNKKLLIKPSSFYELFVQLDLVIKKSFESNDNKFRKIISFLKPFFDEEQKKEEENKLEAKVEKVEKKSENKVELSVDRLTEVSSDSDAIKVLNNIKKSSSLLASYYRKKDFTDLRALRISTFLSWLETDGLPYANGKKTLLYPPAELELDELTSLYEDEKFEEALCLTQEIIEVSPFWIDGHFFLYNIFEKTNNKKISNEVKNTILSFLKTNSGILDFFFNDDTPFASNRVKKWLKDELNKNDENDNLKEESNSSDQIIESIYELANNGKIKEAMQEVAKQYESSASIEEKFNWRLYHAQLAVEFNKKDIALALLEDLQKDIDRFNLDDWNPKLVSKVYSLILNSFTNIDIQNDKLEQIYKRLCKTDINSAFEIELN